MLYSNFLPRVFCLQFRNEQSTDWLASQQVKLQSLLLKHIPFIVP